MKTVENLLKERLVLYFLVLWALSLMVSGGTNLVYTLSVLAENTPDNQGLIMAMLFSNLGSSITLLMGIILLLLVLKIKHYAKAWE